MSELFASTVTDQRRRRLSAAFSAVLHGAVIALIVFLPSSSSLPKARAPEHLSVVHLVHIPQRLIRAGSSEARTRSPVPAKIVATDRAAVGQTVQVGKLEIGALDSSKVEARPTVGYRGSGEVLVGGFGGGTAVSRQLESVGTVGPTDVFDPSGPAQKEAMQFAQHGGDEAARLLWVPTPTYTEEAKRLNVSGEVVLEVKMTASGEVQVLRIQSSLGHGLDQAAIDAVNQTRCRPALKAGRPVDVIATIRVIFKLA